MAGSVLEAILLDQLMTPTNKAAATSAAAAPKSDIASGKWKLHDLIKVAAEIGLIPTDREGTIDQTLRDYRNFVHPLKELRAAHECSEAEALLAKGGLDGICNHFAT